MKVLLDSNVLLRWNIRTAPQSQLVIRAVDLLLASGDLPCYTSQNLGEFWNVLTRPLDRNGFGLKPQEADMRAQVIENQIPMLPDDPAVHLIWRRLLVAHSISGVQVHDARLVASMHVHGIKRILTFNTRDFARFTDIEAIHPADLKN
ncbi:MAG: PIN domain-containing protein [Terracidiphilus sp.]|jgi:predicted nucleic acid-binding protein